MNNFILRYYMNITRKDLLDKLNIINCSSIPNFNYVSIGNSMKRHSNSNLSDLRLIDRFFFLEYVLCRRVCVDLKTTSNLTRLNSLDVFSFLNWLYLYLRVSGFIFIKDYLKIKISSNHLRGIYQFLLPWINRMPIMPDEIYNMRFDFDVILVVKQQPSYIFWLLFSSLRFSRFFKLLS